jgi:hypothetical protein
VVDVGRGAGAGRGEVLISRADWAARGVQLSAVGVETELSRNLASRFARTGLRVEGVGVCVVCVVCRRGVGDAGDSGLRKGELRGEPNWPNGDGL